MRNVILLRLRWSVWFQKFWVQNSSTGEWGCVCTCMCVCVQCIGRVTIKEKKKWCVWNGGESCWGWIFFWMDGWILVLLGDVNQRIGDGVRDCVTGSFGMLVRMAKGWEGWFFVSGWICVLQNFLSTHKYKYTWVGQWRESECK